ncbi:MAG: CotH kinase family protein [Chitinophagales bacterium]|nr:CotH kinase family protein [Chitinophagales bacterium]
MKHTLLLGVCLVAVMQLRAQTFSSTVNQPIPDDGSVVTFDVTVSGLPNVIDTAFGLEQLCINMTHTWDDDVEVRLKSPDGTVVVIFSHVGGDGDGFTNTCLRKDAATTLASGSPPFSGTYRPQGDMGLFNNGQNPNGIWQLIVTDNYAFADAGFLIGWNIFFGNNPAKAMMLTSSNLPIFSIQTGGASIPNDPKIPATFFIIDNNNGTRNYTNQSAHAYDGKMMVELQGYTGPYYPKKNYDFDLIDSSGNKITATLMGLPEENDWILKAEYLDPSLMANPLTYEMSRHMGVYAPRTKYCELLLNGEYMGVYSLTEKIKRDKNRVDIAKLTNADTAGAALSGGYIIEMNINGAPGDWNSVYPPINNNTSTLPVEFKYVYPKRDSLLPVQRTYIKNYVDTFETLLRTDSLQTGLWRDYVSEKSFIDFQIVNEFSSNYDSYGRSTYLYKEKVTDGGQLHIGPPWDYDRAYSSSPTGGWVWQVTHPTWPFPFWWSKLNNDSIYLQKLWCRWTDLRSNVLSNQSFNTWIDSVQLLLQESTARNFEKWSELNVSSHASAVNGFRNFITARLDWMDNNILQAGAPTVPGFVLADTGFCSSGLIGIDSSSGYKYLWSNGDKTSQTLANQNGSYLLTIKNAVGCVARDTAIVTIYGTPTVTITTTIVGDSVVFATLPAGFTSYLWQIDSIAYSSSTVKLPVATHTVQVSVADTLSCEATANTSFIYSALEEALAIRTLRLYPNPTDGKCTVVLPEAALYVVTLYNIMGEIVAETEIQSATAILDISRLSKGVYVLQAKNKTTRAVSRGILRKEQ